MLDNVEEFNNFLKNIKLDSLSTEKEIYSEKPSDKTKACYKRYNLRIDNDTISLSYGYNSNPKNNKRNNSYISEEEICEAAIIWEFKFNGKKLIFIRQVAAG
jgi:hypothetical protein